MRKRLRFGFLIIAALIIGCLANAYAQLVPDDCSLAFAGSDRKPVKNRTSQTIQSYSSVNHGNPISDGQIPATRTGTVAFG